MLRGSTAVILSILLIGSGFLAGYSQTKKNPPTVKSQSSETNSTVKSQSRKKKKAKKAQNTQKTEKKTEKQGISR